MNRFVIAIIGLSLFLVSTSEGQTGYFANGPVWKIRSECAIPFPCIETREYNYYISGDSVFNNYTYHKVFIRANAVLNWIGPLPAQCQGSYSLNDTINPIAFIRDTMNTILLHTPQLGYDTLLYDYNLNIGDTLPFSFNNPHTNNIVVSIDSISISSYYRKRFGIMDINGQSFYLIEGIGHENGFLETLPPNMDCSYELVCYSLGDSSYYPVSGLNCEVVVSYNNESPQKKFSVYPNPSSGQFKVDAPDDNLIKSNIEIYNILGVSKDFTFTDNKITLSHACENLYFIRIKSKKIEFQSKLIIQ